MGRSIVDWQCVGGIALGLAIQGCVRFGYDAVNDGTEDSSGGRHSAAGAGAAGSNTAGAQGASSGATFVPSSGGAEAGHAGRAGASSSNAGGNASGGTFGTEEGGARAGLAGASGSAVGEGGMLTSTAGAGATMGGSTAAGGSSALGSGGTSGTNSTGGLAGSTSTGGLAGSTSTGGLAGSTFTGGAAGASSNAGAAGSTAFPGGTCDWSNGPPAFGAARSLGLPNTAQPEIDPVLSRDGLTLYFVSFRDNKVGNDIYVATRASVTADFDAGTALSEVNSTSNDTHFFVAADGLEAFWASDRSGTLGGADIFSATRQSTSKKWGIGSSVVSVNSTNGDYDPHLESDGLTLWFDPVGRIDGSGLQDLFYAQRSTLTSSFATPLPATSLNSAANEWNVSLTDDGRVIVFQSDRDSTMHVYFAVRANRNAIFGAPRIVTSLDSYISTLSDPFVAPDGCAIYFAATLTGGAGSADLYVVEATP